MHRKSLMLSLRGKVVEAKDVTKAEDALNKSDVESAGNVVAEVAKAKDAQKESDVESAANVVIAEAADTAEDVQIRQMLSLLRKYLWLKLRPRLNKDAQNKSDDESDGMF